MTRRRVVDAHVHFWDPSIFDYPWLVDTPELHRAFLPDDLGALASGAADAVVFVEANCAPALSEREVDWVEHLADAEPRIVGIVAYVNLLDESNREHALDRLARSSRIIAVRHNIQGHEPGFALQPAFVRGVRAVGARGLPFELCVTGEQLGEAAELVAASPETRFVLDHCGKPAIRDDGFAAWARQVEQLASHEAVTCKLSGLLTESRADQRRADVLRRYTDHVIDCFGPARLLYGSDWPVCTLAGGAEVWRGITDELTSAWSSVERQAFYAGNAIELYGLQLPSHV
jgi:L-fuconolactonase